MFDFTLSLSVYVCVPLEGVVGYPGMVRRRHINIKGHINYAASFVRRYFDLPVRLF